MLCMVFYGIYMSHIIGLGRACLKRMIGLQSLFAIPSILCIYSGYHNDTALLWVGVGIASYCPAYFIFHDIIVHRRIKIKYKFKSRYMKRMIRAHQLHHSTSEKDYASSFGFLYVPKDLKLGV